VQADTILDSCADFHTNVSGRKNLEVEPRRGYDLEIPCVAEELENLGGKSRQKNLTPKFADDHIFTSSRIWYTVLVPQQSSK
jgi:hypothetical protein